MEMKRFPLALLILLGACGTPGKDISPESGDFAFIEVKLKG
jgi:hypothetical protein